MRKSILAAAVTAACCAGGVAVAQPPGSTFQVNLYIAGSSAFQTTFKNEFQAKVCGANTMDTWTATGSPAPAFAAYSCTSGAAGSPVNGKTVIAYYRAEGGSLYGVVPIQKNLTLTTLDTSGTNASFCTGASPTYTCTVNGWNFTADTFTSGAASRKPVMLGISDVEPNQFVLNNYPNGTYLGAQPANYNNVLTPTVVADQVFAFYTNNFFDAGHARAVPAGLQISKQSLISIFSGLYTVWNQVPTLDGSGVVDASADPITICHRDVGSGTRTGVTLYLLGQQCTTSSFGMAATPYAINASTGTEVSCVAGHAGAIGYAVQQVPTPANTVQVAINGLTPGNAANAQVGNAAIGNYDYWYEATFNFSAALNATTDELALANFMLADLQDVAQIPNNSANLMASPLYNAINIPVGASRAVSVATRNGNSCTGLQGQN